MTNKTLASLKSSPERGLLTNGLTLIALGFSILFLNSWDNLVVRTSVALFWGAFFVIVHGPEALRTFRQLKQKNDIQRRGSYPTST